MLSLLLFALAVLSGDSRRYGSDLREVSVPTPLGLSGTAVPPATSTIALDTRTSLPRQTFQLQGEPQHSRPAATAQRHYRSSVGAWPWYGRPTSRLRPQSRHHLLMWPTRGHHYMPMTIRPTTVRPALWAAGSLQTIMALAAPSPSLPRPSSPPPYSTSLQR